jgi:hypothetical protein
MRFSESFEEVLFSYVLRALLQARKLQPVGTGLKRRFHGLRAG